MAPSRGQDGQNTKNTGKCPPQPRSGSIVCTHRSGNWERFISTLKLLKGMTKNPRNRNIAPVKHIT